MFKGKTPWIIAVVLVSVGALVFVQTDGSFLKSPAPAAPLPQNLSPATNIAPEIKAAPPAGQVLRSGTLEMTAEPKAFQPSDTPKTADYSYTLRREKKEVVITPGVSYVSGEGLNIKTDKKDEVVQIQRDNSYNTDYQIMLKKKY